MSLCSVFKVKKQRGDIKNKRKVSDSSTISPSACLSPFVYQQNKNKAISSHSLACCCCFLLACLFVCACLLFLFLVAIKTQAGFWRDIFGGFQTTAWAPRHKRPQVTQPVTLKHLLDVFRGAAACLQPGNTESNRNRCPPPYYLVFTVME